MPGGRPTEDPKTKLVALRLPPRLLRFVEQLAHEGNITVSAAIRQLIERRMDEREDHLQAWRASATRAFRPPRPRR